MSARGDIRSRARNLQARILGLIQRRLERIELDEIDGIWVVSDPHIEHERRLAALARAAAGLEPLSGDTD